jgi:hypothetical protein
MLKINYVAFLIIKSKTNKSKTKMNLSDAIYVEDQGRDIGGMISNVELPFVQDV